MNKYQKAKNLLCCAMAAMLPWGGHAQAQFERIGMEGVGLFGTVTFGSADETPGLYPFVYELGYAPDVQNPPLVPAYIPGGSTYHDGKIYCNVYGDGGNLQEQVPRWRVYDAETFELLSEHELNDNCENTTTSLAYDPTTDLIYGFVRDFTDTHFVSIDPETGAMTRIATLDYYSRYYALACNKRGLLYAIVTHDDGVFLSRVRKSDGRITDVGLVSCDNFLDPENDYLAFYNYDQSLFFDNSTDELYWLMTSSSFEVGDYTPIFRLNTRTAEATLVSHMNVYHVSGMFLMEPAFEAPAVIGGFVYEPSETGALAGQITLDIPATLYDGTSADGQEVTVVIREGESEVFRGTAVHGEAFTTGELEFSQGEHHLTVTLMNEAGEGPAVERSLYSGYDLPQAPANVSLSSEGLKAVLTWEASLPEGMHGMPVNQENLSYRIVRYPNTIVAEDVKECRFEEELPSEMMQYAYLVTAMDGDREGGTAASNTYIIGSPLDVPYGGIFTGPNDMYDYYTIIDGNNDGYRWAYYTEQRCALYFYNEEEAADDWMISPPVNFEKGKTYELKFYTYSSMADYPEALEVRFGTGRTPEELPLQLIDMPEVPAVDEDHPLQETVVEFTVEEDGVYYYAFHVYSPAFHEILYLSNIRVEEKDDGSGIEALAAGSSVTIQPGKGCIHIANPEHEAVGVYSLNGVKLMESCESEMSMNVAAGIYLVNAQGEVRKVLVY